MCERAEWVGRVSVVIVKPLQNRAKTRDVWNALELLSSIRRLLNYKTYRRVIIRNGPVLQIFKKHGSSSESLAPQPQVG